MKNILLILLISCTTLSQAQNSAETNLTGTTPIFRVTGNGFVVGVPITQRGAILGNSGTVSTTNQTAGVIGYSANSSTINHGIIGFANGSTSTENIGVLGQSNLNNATGTGVKGVVSSSSIAADLLQGGYFQSQALSNINGSANLYGVSSYVNGLGSVNNAFGINAISTANITGTSYGISATSQASGTGSEYGGIFNANGTSTGSLKIGILTQSSGNTSVGIRKGIDIRAYGPATSTSHGVFSLAENPANGSTYGGYFEARGAGTGTKYGIYSTVSGGGNLYAAILDGSVGIGTTTPDKAGLVVNKIVGNTAAIFGDNTTGVGIDNSWPGISLNGYYNGSRKPIANGYVGGISFDPTTGKFFIYNTATSGTADNTIVGVNRVFIDNQGDLGIGVSDPLATLQVARGTAANGTAAFEGTTHTTHINYSTTEDTYIRGGKVNSKVYLNDTGGNVAVGNINPTEKLHVAGNIKASGSVQATSASINNLTVSSSSSFTGSTTFNNTITATDGFFSGSLTVGGTLSPDVLNVGGLSSPLTRIKRTTLTGQQIFGVVNNTCDLNYYNVPGVLVGDNVILNIDSPFSTLTVANVRASAADTVEVKFCNIGNSNTVLLTGLTFRFMYYR